MNARALILLIANVALLLPAAAGADTCPAEAGDAVCGHVEVPFDRADPSAGMIPVAYELHRHTAVGPSDSTILVDFGGPGVSSTARRDDPRSWFGAALETHDLLLVDARGTGRSGAIDCPDYQHGLAPLIEAEASCAAQLGAAATRYSTADIAADDEAVRAALHIEKLDFVGSSYGGRTAAAFATRYPGHLRSVLLNSPWGEPTRDVFGGPAGGLRRIIERVGEICARSPDCARSPHETRAEIARLLQRVRRKPVTGVARDADGNARKVRVDATYLAVHILDNQTFSLASSGELPAAIDALRRGDLVPLLRLAAEGDFEIPGDTGNPAEYSQGANSATACADQPSWPWSADASLAERERQYAAAVARVDDRPFGPFRAEEIMFSPFGGAPFCIAWPHTGTQPVVPTAARYPDVPTLVLNGEFDLGAKGVRETAKRWPGAATVDFTGTLHTPLEARSCADEIATVFLQTLHAGDTSCASRSQWDYPALRSFPRWAAESPRATPLPGNGAGRFRLRVARVAAETALDALKRNVLGGFGGDFTGLRGGTVHTDYGETFTTTLGRARWADDVEVSGTIHWSFDGGHVDGDLMVDGPGRRDGTLHLTGGWLVVGSPRTVTITGALGRTRVAARVPAG
jgi:pimeloyl-ACP methyl ester carboxylesterase